MKTKKIISVILTIVTLISVLCVGTLSASAATTFSSSNTAPSGSDYVYWNGSKMVKSSGMTTSKIKYIQQFLNWCVDNGKISSANLKTYGASKLSVDGSFGPASKKMTQAFQKQNNLTVDGSFGPNTITKMKSIISSSSTNPKPVSAKYNLIWPTTAKTITGKYGTNGSKRSNGTRYHSGIDIGSKIGDSCYAVADGEVVMCKSSDDASGTIGGRGRYIVIYHSNGNFSSLYEHLNSCSVKVGDKVKAGQKIGTTGNSGWKSKNTHYDAHLHFGLMNGKMTTTGYDLWTVPGKTYNGKTYTNHTFDPDPSYNKDIKYTY